MLPPPKHVFLYFSTFSLHFGIFYISLWFGIFGYLWFCILGSQCFGIFKETLPSLAQRACFYLVLLPVPASTLLVLLCFKHIFTVYNFLPSTQWPLATGNTHSQIALKFVWFSHVLFPNVLFLPSTFSKCTFSTHTFPHILLQMYFCTHVLLTNVVLQSSLAEWQVVTRIAEKTANVTFLPILPFPRYHDAMIAISTIKIAFPRLPILPLPRYVVTRCNYDLQMWPWDGNGLDCRFHDTLLRDAVQKKCNYNLTLRRKWP